jgi:hypothetical protein
VPRRVARPVAAGPENVSQEIDGAVVVSGQRPLAADVVEPTNVRMVQRADGACVDLARRLRRCRDRRTLAMNSAGTRDSDPARRHRQSSRCECVVDVPMVRLRAPIPMTRIGRSVGVGALVVLLASCAWWADRNDPRHQGRTATSWIEELGRQSTLPGQGFLRRTGTKPSLDALKAIGPAAVPACIKALAHDDVSVRIGATRALELYGSEAAAAVPALVEALARPGYRCRPPTPLPRSAMSRCRR